MSPEAERSLLALERAQENLRGTIRDMVIVAVLSAIGLGLYVQGIPDRQDTPHASSFGCTLKED